MPKDKFKILIGKRIAYLRNKKGLSQPELGHLCNKDKQSINRLEQGNINPSVFQLLQITNALGISLSDFFDFKIPEEILEELKE
ncbi:helix-turn-helix domain-containing protein [Solitalea lacus]|uniref:helix-turn-helix domain-containing protein n=1 Tax=Solitalea lacus TaxID=2911172 RepID=UPI001EDB49F6|nr:helix-turn-helix transcriptional regulator [Solitalea lacus]UKJ09211.1 helix-turn-helix domain-containing protein [Solitalea lacus]